MLCDDLDPIDQAIAHNIRFHRMRKQLSQTQLAGAIGVTFQQVQKYENGVNRITASRLYRIAQVLGLPPAALFDGIGNAREGGSPATAVSLSDERQAARLRAAFSRIGNAKLRRRIAEFIEAIAPRAAQVSPSTTDIAPISQVLTRPVSSL